MKGLFKNLTFWVFVGGLLGFALAKLCGDSTWIQNPPAFYEFVLLIKTTFIKLLRMMIAPIVFFSLLGGLISIGEITRLKNMGLITVVYYVATTIIAITIGLVCVFFIHPWENVGSKIAAGSALASDGTIDFIAPKKLISNDADSLYLIFKNIISTAFVNPFEALSTNNILGIVVSALLIGLALVVVHSKESPLHKLTRDINGVIHKVLHWIILTSPIGVFAIVFDFSLKTDGGIFSKLLSFALVVFGATMVHGLIVLPLIALFFAKIGPVKLFRTISKPLLIAFSTASSSATLPVTMQTCEDELGVSKGVSGFVFPLGATMNMDGTALFEGIAAIFLAHLYGIELSTVAMFSVFFMSMISSIGAPGMPSGSMSGMQMVLLAAGIPLEAIGVLLVIERPLDTFRTAVNVEGDIIGALVTQHHMNKKNGVLPA